MYFSKIDTRAHARAMARINLTNSEWNHNFPLKCALKRLSLGEARLWWRCMPFGWADARLWALRTLRSFCVDALWINTPPTKICSVSRASTKHFRAVSSSWKSCENRHFWCFWRIWSKNPPPPPTATDIQNGLKFDPRMLERCATRHLKAETINFSKMDTRARTRRGARQNACF